MSEENDNRKPKAELWPFGLTIFTDESGFAVEHLKPCEYGVPYESRDDGPDVEPCGEPATVRVRWRWRDAKDGWGEWLYLCEEHHAQVEDENVANEDLH